MKTITIAATVAAAIYAVFIALADSSKDYQVTGWIFGYALCFAVSYSIVSALTPEKKETKNSKEGEGTAALGPVYDQLVEVMQSGLSPSGFIKKEGHLKDPEIVKRAVLMAYLSDLSSSSPSTPTEAYAHAYGLTACIKEPEIIESIENSQIKTTDPEKLSKEDIEKSMIWVNAAGESSKRQTELQSEFYRLIEKLANQSCHTTPASAPR